MKSTLSGRLKLAIREGERVVRSYPWQDNLILDQGLDMIATTLFNQVFTNCAVGSGNDPTSWNPGATATVNGTTLTANSAVFGLGQIDANVVFSSGQTFKIQSLQGTAPTATVILTSSGTISTATAFTIQYVNQAVLQNELARTYTCLTTPGACGAIVNPASVLFQRTFLFPPVADVVTYAEVGFSPDSTEGANLFSRIVLGTPVTLQGPSAELPQGQQLQVTYQLTVNFDFGQGPGIFFSGRTATTINCTNLPVQYAITAYSQSNTQSGFLAVEVTGQCPALVGEPITISGCTYAAYNGSWNILDTNSYIDPTYGLSTILSLQVDWTGTGSPSGGILTIPLTGAFFRGNLGVYLINSVGQSVAPSPTADGFFGYGEPSLAGAAWAATAIGTVLGSNGAPTPIPPNEDNLFTALCTLGSYATLQFYLDRSAIITVGPQPDVASFGYGIADSTNQIETFVWNQPHGLAIGSTLTFTFRMSWARS
jgi:hypothetical protein